MTFRMDALRANSKRKAGVLNIAHRGARAFAPENTLAAFMKAKTFGCQMIEIDVHTAKDAELIVHHDDELSRCTDVKIKFPGRRTYFISDFTYDELSKLDAGSWYVKQLALPVHQRQNPLQTLTQDEIERFICREDLDSYASGKIKLPTLKETLEFAQSAGMLVNIELKMLPRMYPGLTDAVVDLIESMSMGASVLISSFDHEQLVHVRRRSASIATAILTSDRLADIQGYLKLLDADAYHPGADSLGVSSLAGLFDFSGIADALQSGYSINVWTCNEQKQMRQLIAGGVTGLISDFPNRVSEVLLATGRNM